MMYRSEAKRATHWSEANTERAVGDIWRKREDRAKKSADKADGKAAGTIPHKRSSVWFFEKDGEI